MDAEATWTHVSICVHLGRRDLSRARSQGIGYRARVTDAGKNEWGQFVRNAARSGSARGEKCRRGRQRYMSDSSSGAARKISAAGQGGSRSVRAQRLRLATGCAVTTVRMTGEERSTSLIEHGRQGSGGKPYRDSEAALPWSGEASTVRDRNRCTSTRICTSWEGLPQPW